MKRMFNLVAAIAATISLFGMMVGCAGVKPPPPSDIVKMIYSGSEIGALMLCHYKPDEAAKIKPYIMALNPDVISLKAEWDAIKQYLTDPNKVSLDVVVAVDIGLTVMDMYWGQVIDNLTTDQRNYIAAFITGFQDGLKLGSQKSVGLKSVNLAAGDDWPSFRANRLKAISQRK